MTRSSTRTDRHHPGLHGRPIFLDYNATTPVDPRGVDAALLGFAPDDVVFTGGGSESDTLAIRGAALAHHERGDHVITQRTEHPAVLAACHDLERHHGFRVTYLRSAQVSQHPVKAHSESAADKLVVVRTA